MLDGIVIADTKQERVILARRSLVPKFNDLPPQQQQLQQQDAAPPSSPVKSNNDAPSNDFLPEGMIDINL